jgi:chemotaxis protein MotB
MLKDSQLTNLAPLLIEVLKTDYKIDVEGHTDDVPLYRVVDHERQTNWSLSGQRAASVLHHLKDYGFKDKRLRIVGYGSTVPKVKIKRKVGKRLKTARAQNRRVSLLIR